MGDLGEHFNASEFQCHNGAALPDKFSETIKDTIEFLERLRGFMNFYVYEKTGTWIDIGIIVISGHRTLEYNRDIGSSDSSRHITGQAADIKPVGGYKYFDYDDFHWMCVLVDRSYKTRPYRIGKYTKSRFVHIDCGYGHAGQRWSK